MSKMAEQKDFHEAAATALPNTQYVQFLRDSYDALVKSESSLSKALENISRRLDFRTLTELIKLSTRCSTNVSWISWAFHLYQKEDLHKIPRNCVWSYFPALESISLCQRSTLPMHRVPQPDTWTGNGHRRQLNPIVCKFTRRMIRDTVLASRGNASRLTTDDLDLPFTAEINRIAIYSHLMLRLQERLHSAKAN